jgi:hypothetical protein
MQWEVGGINNGTWKKLEHFRHGIHCNKSSYSHEEKLKS